MKSATTYGYCMEWIKKYLAESKLQFFLKGAFTID